MIDNVQKESLSELIGEISALREAMVAQQKAFQENLAAQQGELEALRAQVRALEAEKSRVETGPQLLTKATSRRKLLKLGGAAASLAALSSLSVAANRPHAAQAADGSFAVVSGTNLNSNAGSNATYFANNDAGGLASILFRINNFSDRGITPPSPYKIALLATTGGSTTDRNPATRVGVYTATDNGFGLYSVVDQGVGVFAKSSGNDATGVFANVSGLNATGVFALSSNGLGGYFQGGRAALLLQPSGNDPNTSTINHATGELYMDNAGNLWYCVTAGNPGTWRKLGGTSTAGSFHPLTTPSRFIDTRPAPSGINDANHPYLSGTSRSYNMTSLVGRGGATIPAGATGVYGNVTVVSNSAGYLQISPSGLTSSDPSTLNFSASVAIGNAFFSALNTSGQMTIQAALYSGGNASAFVIIDITGYYL